MLCEIGYSPTNSAPSGNDWIWNGCNFNGDWGNNFYYQGNTAEIASNGTRYYTFRFKMGKNGEYTYAGTTGKWDGVSSICGTFQVTD